MHIKTIASAIALSTAMALSGTAMAQTMIGSQEVSEGDRERVQVYCEDLQNRENQAVGASDSDTELNSDTEDDDDNSTGEDAGEADANAPSTSDTEDSAAVGSIDMDLITLQNCMDAGFIQ